MAKVFRACLYGPAGSLALIGLAILLFTSAGLSFRSIKLITALSLVLLSFQAWGWLVAIRENLLEPARNKHLTLLAIALSAASLAWQCCAGFGETLEWGNAWKIGIPLAAIGTALIWKYGLQRTSRQLALLPLAALSVFIALYNLNICLDHSHPVVLNMAVTAKHTEPGKIGTVYYAHLSAPTSYKIDLPVEAGLYNRIAVNDHLCVAQYKGWLQAAWRHVEKCS